MSNYIFRRLFLLLFVLFCITLLAFSLSHLFPGDPLINLSGYQDITVNQLAVLEKKYLIDSSYPTQYLAFLSRLFSGDLGISFNSQAPVFEQVNRIFPATMELAIYSLSISIVIGIPLGVISAYYHRRLPDTVIITATLIGYSIPIFWWALLSILFFSLQLGWFPSSGRISLVYEIPHVSGFLLIDILRSDIPYKYEAFIDAVKHLTLPAMVLSTYPTTVLIRYTRGSMLHVLNTNYIKTARAKGLSQFQVLLHHGLRNALLPVVRLIGLQFSSLITLAMITEVIFSWPGIGRWLIDSIYQRDYPAIQGGLLAVATFVIIVTIASDILYNWFNPVSRMQIDGKI
jgi:cationic peptide transport system permease protein